MNAGIMAEHARTRRLSFLLIVWYLAACSASAQQGNSEARLRAAIYGPTSVRFNLTGAERPTAPSAYRLTDGQGRLIPIAEVLPNTASESLVVPAAQPITVRPLDPSHEIHLTVDGQAVHKLQPGEVVEVARGEHDVPLVHLKGQTFFRTMRRKLNWAARPPERS